LTASRNRGLDSHTGCISAGGSDGFKPGKPAQQKANTKGNMKTKLILTGGIILVAFIFGTSLRRASADPAAGERRHEVVLLKGGENYIFQQLTTNSYITGLSGYTVANSSSSSGAPQFPPPVYLSVYTNGNPTYMITNQTISLAQAMAELISDGFHLQETTRDSNDSYSTYMFVK